MERSFQVVVDGISNRHGRQPTPCVVACSTVVRRFSRMIAGVAVHVLRPACSGGVGVHSRRRPAARDGVRVRCSRAAETRVEIERRSGAEGRAAPALRSGFTGYFIPLHTGPEAC